MLEWVEGSLGPVAWVKVSAGITMYVHDAGVVKFDGGTGLLRATLAAHSRLFPALQQVIDTPWGPAAVLEHIPGTAPSESDGMFAAGYATAELHRTLPPADLPPARWVGPILAEYAARGVEVPAHVAAAYRDAATAPSVWVHGNLHAGNALAAHGQCRFVDSEGTGYGPAVADVVTLLSSAWLQDGCRFDGPMAAAVLNGFQTGGGDPQVLAYDLRALVEGAVFVLEQWVSRLNAQDPANATAWATDAGARLSSGTFAEGAAHES